MGIIDTLKDKFRSDGEFKYDREKSESVSEKSIEWGGDTSAIASGEGA